jgi:CBS-domain-containing membrane protein
MKEVPKEEPKEEKKELKFSDKDNAITVDNEALVIDAPKDVDTLQKIAEQRNIQRKLEEDEDKLKISEEVVTIDVEDLNPKVETEIKEIKEIKEEKEPIIDIGIEILA